MAGRVGFYIGADPNSGIGGSTQDNTAANPLGVDDGMGLTMGTYTGVAGNFASAKFFVGNATGGSIQSQYFGQNAIDTAYWGASDRYFIGETTNENIRIQLRCDVIGDTARCQWTCTNQQATAATLGMWFGQWVTMFPTSSPAASSNFISPYPADWTVAPGVKPILTDTRFEATPNVNATDPPERNMPPYLDYGMDQSLAYGLRIVLQPSAQIPDQTPVSGLDIGNNVFLLGSQTASDGAMPDLMLTDDVIPPGGFPYDDNAYIEKFPTVPLGPLNSGTETTQIIAYYKSTWSTVDYAKPYSVVLDAPPVIATSPSNSAQFQNAPFLLTVNIDDTRGFSTHDQSVPLQDVEVDVDLPPGLTDANNPSSTHLVKFIDSVEPQTVANVSVNIAIDPTVFGNQNYTVTIKPNPGPTKVLTGTLNVASQPYLQLTGTSNCVTAGWSFSDSTWDTIVGSNSGLVLNQDYQVFGWDAVAQNYIIQSGPQRGFGSFVVTTQNVGFVPLGGNPVQPQDLQTGAPQIILQSGWNLIGNPYNYAVPVGQLVGVPESDNQNAFTWDQLSTAGYISGYLAYWDPTTQGYKVTTSDTDLIQPNTGYWLFVNSNQPVTIEYPAVLASFIPNLPDGALTAAKVMKNSSVSAPSSPVWSLQLAARGATTLDSLTAIGQATTSQTAKSLTIYKPPIAPIKNAISSAIVVTSGKSVTRLARALTPTSVNSQTWDWQVYTTTAGTVALTWPNMSTLPANVTVKLVDPSTGKQTLLRNATSYTFEGKAKGTHDFQLVVTTGPTQPVITSLSSVSTASLATLTYVLSTAASSTLTVSQNGQTIATLISNRKDNSGTSKTTWNYLDSANRKVRAGIYTATLSSTPASGAAETKSISITVPR